MTLECYRYKQDQTGKTRKFRRTIPVWSLTLWACDRINAQQLADHFNLSIPEMIHALLVANLRYYDYKPWSPEDFKRRYEEVTGQHPPKKNWIKQYPELAGKTHEKPKKKAREPQEDQGQLGP